MHTRYKKLHDEPSELSESLTQDEQRELDGQRLLREYKCRAYMLYAKYIKRDAELELQLPADYRSVLDEHMESLDRLVNSEMGFGDL